ncbi:MAG: aspartate aminotransferase family protein [Pseudomonadota bacterium]
MSTQKDKNPNGYSEDHRRALNVMPDGVASYSQNRKPEPLYLDGGQGSRVYDVNGKDYIDYMLGAGPLICGHRHPHIMAAIEKALAKGVPNVGVSREQVQLAEMLCAQVPSLESVRFLPTGTEAVQAAIRFARKYTGRAKIAKFEGAYHGQAENVMVSVSAPRAHRGAQSAPKPYPYHCHLPQQQLDLTIVLPFNDLEVCSKIIGDHADDLALVIMEPMLGFAGAIPAAQSFMDGIREITAKHGIVLIFDEVITGFRLGKGGGQQYYGVNPDLTVLAKAIGGGMPIAAVGGSKDVMDVVSVDNHPDDYVFQSGTFSAFPPSVASGIATLEVFEKENTIDYIVKTGETIRTRLRKMLEEKRIIGEVTGVGSLFHVHFTRDEVVSAREAEDADQGLVTELHQRVLGRGLYYYAGRLGFLSGAHTGDDVGYTLDTIGDVLDEMIAEGKFDHLRADP